ncbi:MAG: 2-C-methyl-D-erythritol 4-phosphate cytidylyltransferase [Pseudomonadales bacterium]|nr:2-C-methyl-D-erythritol 4-phosphate cytidylyltransferase [Pseudomonadales bacterium]
MSPHLWLIIPCAGKGRRFGAEMPKQYLSLLNKTVIEKTLDCFRFRDDIKGIIIPHAQDDAYLFELKTLVKGSEKPIFLVEGGLERADSVLNALVYLQNLNDYRVDDLVAVHDAARPCVADEDLSRLFLVAKKSSHGAILASAAVDTVKRISTDKASIVETLDRDFIAMAQTPQVFNATQLLSNLQFCAKQGIDVTDEASAMEACGIKPKIVFGSKSNIKITTADDLPLAAFYLQQRQ